MNYMAKTPLPVAKAEDIQEFLNLARTLIRKCDANARLGSGERVTPAMIRLLTHLQQDGPQTVPTLARSLNTGRQHVQRLINVLLGERLVARGPNPAHQRSWIISLTRAGKALLGDCRGPEQQIAEELCNFASSEDVQTCLGVLKDFLSGVDNHEVTPKPEAQEEKKPRRSKRSEGREDISPPRPEPADAGISGKDEGKESVNKGLDAAGFDEPTVLHEKPSMVENSPTVGLNWNGGGGLQIG